jgi:hypothetical protein
MKNKKVNGIVTAIFFIIFGIFIILDPGLSFVPNVLVGNADKKSEIN